MFDVGHGGEAPGNDLKPTLPITLANYTKTSLSQDLYQNQKHCRDNKHRIKMDRDIIGNVLTALSKRVQS